MFLVVILQLISSSRQDHNILWAKSNNNSSLCYGYMSIEKMTNINGVAIIIPWILISNIANYKFLKAKIDFSSAIQHLLLLLNEANAISTCSAFRLANISLSS